MKNIIQPIVVTMGDPSGIGIEVTLRAWKNRKIKHPFFLIHDYSYVKKIIKKMKINIPLKLISEPNQAVKTYKNFLPIYQLEVAKNTQLGKPNKQNAKVILKSIDMALKFIQSVKQEAFKVTWPSKKDVMVGSLMVFVLATIAALFFLLLDQIYRFLLDILLTINF